MQNASSEEAIQRSWGEGEYYMLWLRLQMNYTSLHVQPASSHPLALFYYCDTAVTHQMQQLNHLMRTSPDNLDRRAKLIAQLKEAQHNMINLLRHITEQLVPAEDRDTLDFRAKYPENVRVDQINGTSSCVAVALDTIWRQVNVSFAHLPVLSLPGPVWFGAEVSSHHSVRSEYCKNYILLLWTKSRYGRFATLAILSGHIILL